MERDLKPAETRKIGLIGGLALRAGVFYYEQILQHCTAKGRTLRLVLGHADVMTVLDCVGSGDKGRLGHYLGSMANELFDAGADVVAVTAVAPHIAITEIARVARGPVVNVLDSVSDGLAAAGIGRVAVFGNRTVMETDVFDSVRPDQVVRAAPDIVQSVHATYSDIALSGKRGTPAETTLLEGFARNLIDRGGAEAILLAGTDLSSFYAGRPPSFPFLDMAKLHIDAILRSAGMS